MNRRSYFKGVFALAAIGTASFSVFKWFDLKKAPDPAGLTSKREIIAELAELIIPATDTPGAKAAGVHDYIINVMINCVPVHEQKKFISGLEDLEDFARSHTGKDFLKCGAEEKRTVLEHEMNHSELPYRILNKIYNKLFGQPFYPKLRDLTIEGYCMSRLGATQGLAYDYIPSTYEACIPLRPHQKSWATK